ncbi:helix-turn-helix domain-containing protein [Sphingomonas sp. DT-51]|uniref:helix-turn-helix domain-containing protein n=1 Tax=Sphingomonas sp. DT-51 TaxID=3396165 RepID=UPI003F1CCA4E
MSGRGELKDQARQGEVPSPWRRKGAPTPGLSRDERASGLLGLDRIVASHSRGATDGPSDVRIPVQDGFSLVYMMAPMERHRFWSDEGRVELPHLPAGSMQILDLAAGGNARLPASFASMNVTIPRHALSSLVERAGGPIPENLRVPKAWEWRDGLVDGLVRSIAASIAPKAQVDDLTYDHLLLALATHLAVRYGGMRSVELAARPVMSAAQLGRAQEAIVQSLEHPVSLAEIAGRCDLSPSAFTRAFKQATGRTTSAWRLDRRIELAKRLLRADEHAIAEVAVRAGFADQSHFTRTFSKMVGTPPGRWLSTSRRSS